MSSNSANITASSADWEQQAWAAQELAQLHYFASMSLRDKVLVMEGMDEVAALFPKNKAANDAQGLHLLP